MAVLIKQVCVWTGPGALGGGVSTFYWDGAHVGSTTALKAFFTTVMAVVPTGTAVNVPASGDLIDSVTGALEGTWNDGTTGTIAGTGTGKWAAGVGARLIWMTAGVTNNRRVRGSTFIVPITAANFDTDGTLDPAVSSVWQSAGSTLLTHGGGGMYILTKPIEGAGGKSNLVNGCQVPDRISWLRSRRV